MPVALHLPGIKAGDPNTVFLEANPSTITDPKTGTKYSKKYYDIGYKIDPSRESQAYNHNPLFHGSTPGAITYGDMMKQVEKNKRSYTYKQAIADMHNTTGYQATDHPSQQYAKHETSESSFGDFMGKLTNLLNKFVSASKENNTIHKQSDASRNLPHSQAREILREAYKRLFHRDPTDGELDFGLATAFFESGYGRAGSANWAKPGQFARWASEGLYNWGALESGIPGPEGAFNKFQAAGLNPVKKKGSDAGRPAYFYLFPSDVDAAQAFLMTWGRPDTLKAAATGSPQSVAAAMRNHGYYEGFWVPPGNPQHRKIPPFKEANSIAEAEANNIKDYASALNNHRAVVSNVKPSAQQYATNQSSPSSFDNFMAKLTNLLNKFVSASSKNNYLISVGSSSDYTATMEYARILSTALQEYFDAKTTICANENNIEIECKVNGNQKIMFDAIKELSAGISDAFGDATIKLGTITTFSLITTNSKSEYDILHPRQADLYSRKFRLKFARIQ